MSLDRFRPVYFRSVHVLYVVSSLQNKHRSIAQLKEGDAESGKSGRRTESNSLGILCREEENQNSTTVASVRFNQCHLRV